MIRIVGWLGLGLVIGAVLGLFLGWVAWPIEFSEADPTVLEDSYQRDFAIMIASAYSLDEDLSIAQRRLKLLGKEDVQAWFLSITVEHILNGGDEIEIRHLVKLANDLDLYSPAMDPFMQRPGAAETG